MKKEKWRLNRDNDLREFCEDVKLLVIDNCRVAVKRKRDPRNPNNDKSDYMDVD